MLETRHNDPLVRMLTLAALTIICLAIPQLLFAASLDQLIAKAKQEQVLNAHVVSGIIGTTQAKLIAAFKKHFGTGRHQNHDYLASRSSTLWQGLC